MKEKKRKCVAQKEPSEVFLEKILWRRRSSLNFAKFLRTAFLQNISGRLLLYDVCFWQFFENKKSENSRIFTASKFPVFYSYLCRFLLYYFITRCSGHQYHINIRQ